MPSSDRLGPVAMRRIALVAPRPALRALLVHVAAAGVVEVESVPTSDAPAGPATRALQRLGTAGATPRLMTEVPDLDRLERAGQADVIAGEAALEQVAAGAVTSPSAAAVAGWTPVGAVGPLAGELAGLGAAVVPLPRPRGVQPPTLLRSRGGSRPYTALVQTYSTVPYADLDPTPFAAAAYVVMFGLMFGDVGHGLMLVLLALLARAGRPHVLVRLRPAVPLVAAAGVSSMVAGALYGEFFGPTDLVAPVWLAPLEDPMRLLLAGLAVGALLLAVAYAIGTANRVREGGWSYALYAPSGLAGSTLFLGMGLLVAGLVRGADELVLAAVAVAALGLFLSFVGLYVGSGGGGSGVAEALVELVDLVVRLGSNVVSFARLAAFGLTHAALGAVVWGASTALWLRGGPAVVAAVVVFLVGNAVAFALEALVAAVQALRLEYYELFSRVFEGEGRPFRPWHLPLAAPPAAAPGPLPATASAPSTGPSTAPATPPADVPAPPTTKAAR
jgi:V/A-type H+/Na+-transporting ATPase subunit I